MLPYTAESDLNPSFVRPETVAPRADRPAAGRPKGMQLGKAKKATDMLTAMAKVPTQCGCPSTSMLRTGVDSVAARQSTDWRVCQQATVQGSGADAAAHSMLAALLLNTCSALIAGG